MPELPEVETIRRTLEPLVVNQKITAVEILDRACVGFPDPQSFQQRLACQRVAGLERRGKYLIWELTRQPQPSGLVLVVHLRMTGRLVYKRADDPPDRYRRLVLRLENGDLVEYADLRRFGRLWLLSNDQEYAAAIKETASSSLETIGDGGPKGLWGLGPEPLAEGFSASYLQARCAGRRATIKSLLLDQEQIAGVGSIYADEALFRAGIHPARPAGTLDESEIGRLVDSLKAVLAEAIAHRGTTFSDYRDGRGQRGAFYDRLSVYGREGKPCPRCGSIISRGRAGGRSYRFCPQCQK